MKAGIPVVLGLVVLAGCATPEQRAQDFCAAKGKEFVTFEGSDSPKNKESATTAYGACVNPNRLVRTNDAFGALLVAGRDVRGAEVLKVAPGSIADHAGLQHQDIVVTYSGHPIESAADLQKAVSETAPGSRVVIKLHRDELEQILTAQF